MTLLNGDCLELLKTIPDQSVDLTVTSPPYDSLRSYEGLLFDKFKAVAKELYRVTKPGGVVVWVVGDATVNGSETGTSFKQALYFKECGFNLHDTMIYHASKRPFTHNRYEQAFEYMFILSKGKPKTFNAIKVPCSQAGKKNSGHTSFRQSDNSLRPANKNNPTSQEKIKENIWFYLVGYMKTTKDKEAYKHPAIFPESLAADHISSWSNEGDTVLDIFLGSGTTGKMAKILNRRFIGIEKDEKYFEIAKKRINQGAA